MITQLVRIAMQVAIASSGAAMASDPAAQLSAQSSDSELLAAAIDRNDALREALTLARTRAAYAPSGPAADSQLAFARRVAEAQLAAWRDSFLVQQVNRFARHNRSERVAWVSADSLRRAGNDAVSRDGIPTAMRLWRRSIAAFIALHDTAGRAAGLGNLGSGWYLQGDLDSAVTTLARARSLAQSVGDWRTAGNAVGTLASVSKDRGDLRGASTLYEQSLAIRKRTGDTRGEAADRNNLGLIAQSLGDMAGAERAFNDALRLNQTYGHRHAAAVNLTNLGNLSVLAGDTPRAGALYRAALSLFRLTGERADAAELLHDLGLLEMRQSDYVQAGRTLANALALADSTESAREAIAVLIDLAAAQAAMGDLEGSEASLRDADRRSGALRGSSSLGASLSLARADLAAQMNRLDEADHHYGAAARLYDDAGDRNGAAAAQQGRGLLLAMRERYRDAIATLELASRTQLAARDSRAAATTRLLTGYAQRLQGDTALARRTLTGARNSFASLHDPAGEAAALGALGELAMSQGSSLNAEALYRRALTRLGDREAPDVAWRLHAGLGQSLHSRGALAEAAFEFRRSITILERASGSLRVEERRAGFLADKWDVYGSLARTELERGEATSAFAVSEQMRARQMLDLLARGRIQISMAGKDSAAAREQALRHRINELTLLLAGQNNAARVQRGPAPRGAGLDTVREALNAAQQAYAELLVSLKESDPEYARLVSPEPVSGRVLASELTPREVFLEYLVSDSGSVVFVVTHDTVAAVPLDVRRRDLAPLVDYTRDAIEHPGGTPRWRTPLERLYGQLVQPLDERGYLRGKQTLIIAPHGDLHFLPFGALMAPGTPSRFLIERFDISYVPSASVWERLMNRRQFTGAPSVLALAPRPDALPATRAEVDEIGRLFGSRATLLRGGAATKRALLSGTRGHTVMHLASLGVLNKQNPLFSYVELAPADGDNGRLEVHEVFGATLDAQLVVLSACQTAIGAGQLADVPAGDDWIGFVEAFLHAGARHVLATLWPVEDNATALMMERFYRGLSVGRSEIEALAMAQREAIKDPATSQPYRWAGFELSGAR